MKFVEPVSEDVVRMKHESRKGLGGMSDEEIRAYVDQTDVKRVLRRILRTQRDILRQAAKHRV